MVMKGNGHAKIFSGRWWCWVLEMANRRQARNAGEKQRGTGEENERNCERVGKGEAMEVEVWLRFW
jgi:hypothetical protein